MSSSQSPSQNTKSDEEVFNICDESLVDCQDISFTGSADQLRRNMKRGPYKKRSDCWLHMTPIFINEVRHGKCNYCGTAVPADPKVNGTTRMNTHYQKCELNPANQTSGTQMELCATELENIDGVLKGSLGTWKFDPDAIRKSISYMVVVDELPFKFVEGKGFQKLMRTACPSFKIPSRWTISRDCYQLYLDEKIKLKSLLKSNKSRICLTTDTWTSNQRINYMCLTAHFVDNDWRLNKKILNFCPITSHKGFEIGNAIVKCLLEWNVDDILTITVDNASSNDTAVQYLKDKLETWGKTVLGSKWLHVRCVAHITNLIVTDGIKMVGESVDKIRAAVKYVRQSPARLKRFKDCADHTNIESKKLLCLDVATRWNSTYLMLDTAILFERAFNSFGLEESSMVTDIGCLPTRSDWINARNLVVFLKNFYHLTLNVSGTKYVTSNNFFNEISHVHSILGDMEKSDDRSLRSMAAFMREKYNKYWGKIDKINMLILISSILDPRYKIEYLGFVLCEMYGENDGEELCGKAKNALREMFNEYFRGTNLAAPKCSSKSSQV